jgi:hypothetical protein
MKTHKKETRKGRSAPAKVEFVAYVRYVLTNEWKAKIRDSHMTAADAFDFLCVNVEAGYRVGLNWDAESGCYLATMFDNDHDRPTAGYILSARHTDPVRVVATLRFLHEVAFAQGWPLAVQQALDYDW